MSLSKRCRSAPHEPMTCTLCIMHNRHTFLPLQSLYLEDFYDLLASLIELMFSDSLVRRTFPELLLMMDGPRSEN